MNLLNMTNRMNLNIINKIFLPAIICFGINVWGQTEGDPFQYNVTDKMFLPTPEQASLMKFIDIPAGNHTGVHGYSVPIYTIQGKDFSLPISISYHGGGIKVDELSSSVGIGWALNIGGISFSEEVRGERDLDGLEKLNYFDPQGFDTDYGDPSQGGSEHYNAALRMTGIQTTGMEGIPEAELQPDYYSYSLLNNNGRFIRDNLKKARTVPKDDVLIWDAEFQGQRHQYNQRLTDNNGIDYYFSSYEQDHVPGINAPRVRYSYKIDSIVIPNSGTIKFEYYDVSYKYISSRSKTKKMITNGFPYVEEPTGIAEVRSTIREYLPKSVTYKQTKVIFKYKMAGQLLLGRLDVNEGGNGIDGKKGGTLEYIEIWDEKKINLPNSTPLKKYKLTTNYFQNYRLKLDKIENITEGTNYVFSYVGEDQQKFLPPRFSYAQDFWGMYNGKHDNDTSVPHYLHQKSPKGQFIPGADKHPDTAFAKIGSLQKVKLPTGGSQIFEYELDEFRNTDFPDDYIFSPIHQFEQMNFQIIAGDSHSFNVEYPILAEQDNSVDFAQGYHYNFYFNYDNNPNANLPPGSIPTAGTYYYAKILKNGIELPQIIYGGAFQLPDDDFLPGNTYEVIIKKNGSGSIAPFAIFGAEWIHDYISAPKNRNTGTLRIKSITLNDSDGNQQLKKNYSYTDFDDQNHPDISSGVFTATKPFPYSYATSEKYYLPGSGNPIIRSFLNIPDNALLNQNSSFGKSVLYKKVTETYVSTDSLDLGVKNHKKEYIFSPPEVYVPISLMPVLPAPHQDFLAGLLLEERIYNNLNQKVKVTKNMYNNEEPDFFFNTFSRNFNSTNNFALSPSLAVANTGFEIVYIASLPMMVYTFGVNYSFVHSAWIKLLETTTETYENGMMIQSQTQEYKYDNTNNEFKNIHPIETITYNSRNEELKTEYVYGHPYKKDEPTIMRQYEKNSPTYVKETTFQGGLPKHEFAKKAANTLDNVLPSEDLMVTYDSYDANSNLTQYTMANGTPVSIIWGYNGQYPIAKVEGITYSILQTINDPDNSSQKLIDVIRTVSNSDNDRCISTTWNEACKEGNLRIKLNQLRFHSFFNTQPAMITTYTYDPLLGITSTTQPNGQTEYYSYDTAGRLDEVYIMEMDGTTPVKRILKTMDYNYKP